jgi:hypothetical protein
VTVAPVDTSAPIDAGVGAFLAQHKLVVLQLTLT